MIKKLLLVIVALIGCSSVAGVVLVLVYSPRYLEDVEFRCQFDMQYARLLNAMINRDGTLPIIEMYKESCESLKGQEKLSEEFEKERKEYYHKKARDYSN